MKIKKADIWRYFPVLSKMSYTGTRFNYVVVKARRMLADEYAALFEAQKPPAEVIEMQQKFQQEHARLKGQLTEEELKKELDKVLEKLNDDYRDAINSYQQQLKDFAKLLEEMIEMDLPRLHLDDLPPNLSDEEIEALMSLGILE